MTERLCKSCHKLVKVYNRLQTRCINCIKLRSKAKPQKPINKKGKQTTIYETWRDIVAKPYLDKRYGRICDACKGVRCGNRQLDVDHKENRGSHSNKKMDIHNIQYLGRFPCHYEKTNRIKEK